MIRIGIIGAGKNTCEKHIPELQKIQGVSIISVCNRNYSSSETVANKYNIPKVANQWQEIVNDPSLDAIVIGTWPYLHSTLTIAALHSGKHVLCEARMAMNSTQAHAMLLASQQHPELVTQLVPASYTFTFDKTVQRLISEKYLGEILVVDLKAIGSDFIDYSSPLTWRQDIELSGYNIMTMGIWYECLMRWIGHANSVNAKCKTFVPVRKNAESGECVTIQVPDHVDVLAEMACGAQARMQFSSVTGLAPQHNGIWLFGSEGTLHLDYAKGLLEGGKRGQVSLTPIEIEEKNITHWNVEAEFINSIRTKSKVKLTNFEEGVKYMEFTEAVIQSAATGNVIHLPLFKKLNGNK